MVRPTVDIVIAGRNEARWLGDCLAALTSQDYPEALTTIYVVDDGSTDATAEIARKHGVTVLQGLGLGAGAARNVAIVAGTGNLVGLLDAHCVPERQWISEMVAAFEVDDRLGGCMGHLDCLADDTQVQRYLDTVEKPDERSRLADTLSGTRNIYPWILSGNTVFRRPALEAVGGFAEDLVACEDVDISWRVVLIGYQLAYVPAARAVHYEGRPWPSYLYKGLRYGAGGAELAHRYRAHGAARVMRPHKLLGKTPAESISRLSYVAGYLFGWARLTFRPVLRPSMVPFAPVPTERRPAFTWIVGHSLRISPNTIYWNRPDRDDASVIVHVPSGSRFVLEGAGDFMWRSISLGKGQVEITAGLVEKYAIAEVTAQADLDDFVSELAASGVLVASA